MDRASAGLQVKTEGVEAGSPSQRSWPTASKHS